MKRLTTGALAKAAAVNIETIRYYERSGLLKQPPRTPSGYRQYSAETVRRIRFIKRAQQLGFTLVEIRTLLALQFETHLTCDDFRQQAEAKITEIEKKIASLVAMKDDLLSLVMQCEVGTSEMCTALLNAVPSPTILRSDQDSADAHDT